MLVLLDIDGTLLASDRVGARAVQRAAAEVFGRALEHDGASYAGRIDPEIYASLCAANGIAEPERHGARFRTRYAEVLAELLADGARVEALAGARELVDALAERADVTLGVLSGNWPETGRQKLVAAGIAPERFALGAWGDDGAARRELPRVALRRYRELAGRDLAPERAVVVGDTPADVDCARACGCRSLAVATGRYGVAELVAAGADDVLASLAPLERALARLGLA